MRRRSSRSSSSEHGTGRADRTTDRRTRWRAEAQRCARAVIEYDGTAFAGSQYQPNARTVQGELEEALNRLTGERIRVRSRRANRCRGACHRPGRGLLPRRGAPGEGSAWPELRRRLNAALPPDLAVRSLRSAPLGFDPRRDALCARLPLPDPDGGRAAHRSSGIGRSRSTTGSTSAPCAPPRPRSLGERDFAALGSDAHGAGRSGTCRGPRRAARHLVEVRVTANAFLRRMVREHRGAPPGGRAAAGSRRRRSTELLDRPATRARRAGGAGPRADPRAGHLSISQIDNRTTDNERCAHTGAQQGMTESRKREDLRSQGERDRAQLVGGRRHRPDPRPAGDADRHPARGQAQADLLAASRHRRPRRGPQRREDQGHRNKLRQKRYFRHSGLPRRAARGEPRRRSWRASRSS